MCHRIILWIIVDLASTYSK